MSYNMIAMVLSFAVTVYFGTVICVRAYYKNSINWKTFLFFTLGLTIFLWEKGFFK